MRAPDDYAEVAGLLVGDRPHRRARSAGASGSRRPCRPNVAAAPLRELLAQFHRDRGDTEAALDVFWIAFKHRPSLTAYRRVVREADAAGDGERWRTTALVSLQQALAGEEAAGSEAHVQHLSATIIEVLLFEGRVADTWRVATERDCDQRLWVQLARAPKPSIPKTRYRSTNAKSKPSSARRTMGDTVTQ